MTKFDTFQGGDGANGKTWRNGQIVLGRFISRPTCTGHSCRGGLGEAMSDANGFGVGWAMALLEEMKG